MAEPVWVVGPEYCISDNPMELRISRKALTFTDVEDNDLFKVDGKFSLHKRRILCDTAGNPIVTLCLKMKTRHSRWLAFKGDSHDKKDLLFSTVMSSCLQWRTKLNVFLADNKIEKEPDFRLKGRWGSCNIYTGHGNSKSILAQMTEKTTEDDTFGVTINPNVDHTFIVALLVILDKVDNYQKERVLEIFDITSNAVESVSQHVSSSFVRR